MITRDMVGKRILIKFVGGRSMWEPSIVKEVRVLALSPGDKVAKLRFLQTSVERWKEVCEYEVLEVLDG